MILKKNFLKKTKIYAIIDPDFCKGRDPFLSAKAAIIGGAEVIQLRCKNRTDGYIYRTAVDIAKECRKRKVIFLINDRVDIAKLTGADGVHLGQNDIPVKTARSILGSGKIIGLSTHNTKEIREALRSKPDYIGFGPVFKTKTKMGLPDIVGLMKLKEAARSVLLPVVAIGGINEKNIRSVAEAGADYAALISVICGAKDIKKKIKVLIERIK